MKEGYNKIHLINGTTRENMSCGKTQADMKKDNEAYSDDINFVDCPDCVRVYKQKYLIFSRNTYEDIKNMEM